MTDNPLPYPENEDLFVYVPTPEQAADILTDYLIADWPDEVYVIPSVWLRDRLTEFFKGEKSEG